MTTATHKKYKYRIREKLNTVTNGHLIKNRVHEKFKLSRATFDKYINLPIDSPHDVPVRLLIEFSRELNCEISELINQPELSDLVSREDSFTKEKAA